MLAITFSADGRRVVSAGDNTIKVWELKTARLLRTISENAGQPRSIAISPDGRQIVSGDFDHTIKVWDAESGRLQQTLTGHTSSVESIAFSPDGRRIVSGSWDNSIKLWEAASGRLLHTLSGHSRYVQAFAFFRDRRRIVSASKDRSLMIWDSESGRRNATIIAFNSVDYVVIGKDGFFTATPRAMAYMALVRGSEVIPLPDDYNNAFMKELSLDEIAASLK